MSSLCETCDKEKFFKCPWVMCGVPVKEWAAKKIRCKEGGHTYKVLECPGYVPEQSNKLRCRICGKVLDGKRSKYCSEECTRKANKILYHKRTPEKKCAVCGAVLLSKHKTYCSEECRKEKLKKDARKRREEKCLLK